MTNQEFWDKQKQYNTFDKYKDEVKYDYVIDVKLPIDFKLDNGDNAEIEHWDFIDNETGFEEDIDNLIGNEDWLQGPFNDIAPGRVYVSLQNDVADNLELKIGISLKECEDPSKVTEQTLKEDTQSFIEGILENVEEQHFNNQESEDGPNYIKLVADPSKAQIEITKTNTKVDEDYIKQTLTDIDKKLVKESQLSFCKDDMQRTLTLEDDGVMELCENNKWISSQPFSRIQLEKICRSTLEEGYSLTLKQESEIKTKDGEVIDTEKEKEEMEQTKQELADIKQAKEEIDNTVEELFTEEKEPLQISDKIYTVFDIKNLTEDSLSEDELKYICDIMGSLDNFKNELQTVINIVGLEDSDEINTLDEILKYYKRKNK